MLVTVKAVLFVSKVFDEIFINLNFASHKGHYLQITSSSSGSLSFPVSTSLDVSSGCSGNGLIPMHVS